jgi:hypothetical protein
LNILIHTNRHTGHAASVLGVALRPTASHGCELFATRPFRKRQLIAPYLGHLIAGKRTRTGGRERLAFDLTCRDAAVRTGYRRTVSPYAVDFSARQVIDATCMRSWASMANHGPTPRERNAELARYNVLHDGFVRVPSRGNDGVLQYKDRRHYVFPEVLEYVQPGRLHLDRLCVWLKATRDIAAGQPILVDYTPRTPDGYRSSEMARVVHRTVGSLCPAAPSRPAAVAVASGTAADADADEDAEEDGDRADEEEEEGDGDGDHADDRGGADGADGDGEAEEERFDGYALDALARGYGRGDSPWAYGPPNDDDDDDVF